MANDIQIKGKISVDTGNTEQAVTNVTNKLKGAGDEMQKVGGSSVGMTGNFSNLKKTLGDCVPALGGVTDGIGKVNMAFKALLANYVVLILAAIAAALYMLYKAFTSTADGADQLSFIFDGMKAVVLTVRDTILGVGKAIVKFFSGDFKGAMEEGSNAVNGFGYKCEEAFNRAYDASKQLDDIEDRMKELDVQRAKSNAAIKASKELLNDENATYEQKKKALSEVAKLESETSKEELDLAQRKMEALKQKNKAQIENKTLSQEQIDEMQQAEIAYYNKQEELTGKQIQLQKQERALDKQQAAEKKAAHDEQVRQHKERMKEAEERKKAAEKELEEFRKLTEERNKAARKAREQERTDEVAFGEQLAKEEASREAALQKQVETNERVRLENKKKLAELELLNDPNSTVNKLAKIDADLQLELSKLAEGDLQRQVLLKKAANEKKKIEEESAAASEAIREKEMQSKIAAANASGDMLNNLSALVGRGTAVGKAAAVSAATISMFTSAQQAYQRGIEIPFVGMALGPINAGLAIATGIKNIKEILKVKVPNGGGGGGSAPSISTPVTPVTPQAQRTTIDQTSVNAIGNAAQGGTARAYLLPSDMLTEQERQARIHKAASIG